MRINSKIQKFQEGGPVPVTGDPAVTDPAAQMPADGGAPADAAAGDPILQLYQLAQQALQSGDGNTALQVCQGFVQLVESMAGEQAPAPAAPAGEPVFKRGGKIVKRV